MIESEGLPQVLSKVRTFQQKSQKLSKDESERAFIELASSEQAPHNVHLYNLRRKKGDPTTQVKLAVGDRGISVHEVSAFFSLSISLSEHITDLKFHNTH